MADLHIDSKRQYVCSPTSRLQKSLKNNQKDKTNMKKTWACSECMQHSVLPLWMQHCPGCYHRRCEDCQIEQIERSCGEQCGTSFHYLQNLKDRPPSKSYDHRQQTKNAIIPAKINENGSARDIHSRNSTLQATLKLGDLLTISGSRNDSVGRTAIAAGQRLAVNRKSSPSHLNSTKSLKISPATEPSKTPSEIFSSRECFIQSDTNIDDNDSDSGNDDCNTSNPRLEDLYQLFQASEPYLHSLLGHDRHLAALLLPRIHHLARMLVENHTSVLIPLIGFTSKFASKNPDGSSRTLETYRYIEGSIESRLSGAVGTTDATQNKGSLEASNQPVGVSSASTLRAQTNYCPQVSRTQKHDRSPDEPERPGGASPSKKSRHSIGDELAIHFACHFHKDNPVKYGARSSNKKHRKCGAATIPSYRLSRIKDHYKSAHRILHCDRWKEIFESYAMLIAHGENKVSCEWKPWGLKEGIDNKQWERIGEVLKQKGKTDIDKWYEIWEKILFCGVASPLSPFVDSQDTVTSQMPDVATFMRRLNGILQEVIQQKNLRVDSIISESYVNAARQAYVELVSLVPISGQWQSRAEGTQERSYNSFECFKDQGTMEDQEPVVQEDQQGPIVVLEENDYPLEGAFFGSDWATIDNSFNLFDPGLVFQDNFAAYQATSSESTHSEGLIAPTAAGLPYEATQNRFLGDRVLFDEMISGEVVDLYPFLIRTTAWLSTQVINLPTAIL